MFYRKFSLLFQDIIVVGCGGTGSRIIQPLVQIIKQATTQINPCLYLVDADIVEAKNLSRQNFIEPDIGRPKAMVLAERYGAALDFPIVADLHMVQSGHSMIENIRSSADAQELRRPTGLRRLVIMCVDSIEARLEILRQCNANDVIIDAGNEDTFGQVSIYDRVSLPHLPLKADTPMDIKPFSGECELPFIPAPITAYQHALANPPAATGSCADLDQSLAINNMMAAGICNLVQNLAYDNLFYCRTLYFDLIKGNNSERMTNMWLNQMFNERLPERPNGQAPSEIDHQVQSYSEREMSCKHFDSRQHNQVQKAIATHISNSVQTIDPAILAALGR